MQIAGGCSLHIMISAAEGLCLASSDFVNSRFQRCRHNCEPEQNRRVRDAGLEYISQGYCMGCSLPMPLAAAFALAIPVTTSGKQGKLK